ncbi:Eco57I restriction-modification methylase domain-containing protein [Williamsia muralis]|uniref:Eco57I restriction-modification methylase domain-containing protein n=1 Tax=Williamsia marianensis TaxID=85044 RepID=UPI00380D6A82
MSKTARRNQDFHSDWLTQVDIEGPFLALPVLKDMWPDGVDRLGDADDRLLAFKQAFSRWQRALDQLAAQPLTPESKATYDEVNRAWIDTVLDQIAEWDGLRTELEIGVQSPGEQITVTATSGLAGRDGETAAMLLVCEPTSGGLRETGLDGWAANAIDRLAMLLRKAGIEVGIVTDGQWWALVWAKDGKPTGSGMVNALHWAEEPLLRDAFLTLVNQRRFRAPNVEQRLTRLFERSELEAETITEALGTQVRKSVELLVQAFSEERLNAAKNGDPDPLTEKPDDVYQAAVTIMMRIVFLLFAEERDMLPTEQLYWDSYAIKDLLTELQAQASGGEEHLDETYDTWHRLLTVSQALHGGVNYDEMRMPAYGGSLLDPERFPWLYAIDDRGLQLRVSDRVMMHVLESVQTVVTQGERRRISFREIDVEQIGYIYEGLLGYSCAEVIDDIVLGLVGKDGEEPEIPLGVLSDLYDDNAGDPQDVSAGLVEWAKEDQPAATSKSKAALAKLIAKEPTADERAELVRLLTPVANGDSELLEILVNWGNLIRRDLRNIPLVFPIGGLVVVETPSRKNAGAHYTPRSLAEEVVLHALQPLVYEPGPLQTNDGSKWKLKSSAAILDLKVADIAAGSGAFLVAAARYLSECLVEAWTREDMLGDADLAHADEVKRRAMREVIARCLYGADINPMAVEMSKLSLWLVSMDKSKPFSFVDDKIFSGNSLLGLTDLDQLRYLHIYPEPTRMHQSLLVDIDVKLAAAARLRRELASPVQEQDPMRSSRAKQRLLEQVGQVTADLRLIADGVVAAGLMLGGKPGRQLDDAFNALSWQVQEAFRADGSVGDVTGLDQTIRSGLTPIVETDYERWNPIHWVVEAPDVMVEAGGFDAVIGNPPFLRVSEQTAAMGENIRDFVIEEVAGGVRGMADFVAYFFRRAGQLGGDRSAIGLIATNSIAQNHSSKVGLAPLVASGWVIYEATKTRAWPAQANFHYSMVALSHSPVAAGARLDGVLVDAISPLLDEVDLAGVPMQLDENLGRSFEGYKLTGEGFIITDEEAQDLLDDDPRNVEVVRPYLITDDITGRVDESPSRWAVDFGTRDFESAAAYPGPMRIVEARVKPGRLERGNKNDRERWWQYARPRPALRSKLEGLDFAIVIGVVAKWLSVSRQPRNVIYSNRLIVVPNESHALFGFLCSSFHESWTRQFSGRLEDRLVYNPTSAFRTLPFPSLNDALESTGERWNNVRSSILRSRDIGLNSLGNLLNAESCQDDDVCQLREALVALDNQVLLAYGWNDIRIQHGFHPNLGVTRFTLAPSSWQQVRGKLIRLNHERARAEGKDVSNQNVSDRQDILFT